MSKPRKPKPTLDDFLFLNRVTRDDVFRLGERSKRGVLTDAEVRTVYKLGAKLLTKKWNHLWNDYFAISQRGADKAVSDLRCMWGGSAMERKP